MSREFSLPYRPLHHGSNAHALAEFKIPYIKNLLNWKYPNTKTTGDSWKPTDFLPFQLNNQTAGLGKFLNVQGGAKKGKRRLVRKPIIEGKIKPKNKAIAISIIVGNRYARNGHNPKLSATNAATKYPASTPQPQPYTGILPVSRGALINSQIPSHAELLQVMSQAARSAQLQVPTNTAVKTSVAPTRTEISGLESGVDASDVAAREFAYETMLDPSLNREIPREQLVEQAARVGVRRVKPLFIVPGTASASKPARYPRSYVPPASSTRQPPSVSPVPATGTGGRKKSLIKQAPITKAIKTLAKVSNPPYRPPILTSGFAIPVTRKPRGRGNLIPMKHRVGRGLSSIDPDVMAKLVPTVVSPQKLMNANIKDQIARSSRNFDFPTEEAKGSGIRKKKTKKAQ